MASLVLVWVLGSEYLSCRIFSTSSSESRSGSGRLRRGRLMGGSGMSSVRVPHVRRSGDEGAVVSEYGEGMVGGGRWMNVSFSSGSCVTTAFGLFSRGSVLRMGGRSAVPGRGRGYFVAYCRANRRTALFMSARRKRNAGICSHASRTKSLIGTPNEGESVTSETTNASNQN